MRRGGDRQGGKTAWQSSTPPPKVKWWSLGGRIVGSNCSPGSPSVGFLLLCGVCATKAYHPCRRRSEKALWKAHREGKRQPPGYRGAQISQSFQNRSWWVCGQRRAADGAGRAGRERSRETQAGGERGTRAPSTIRRWWVRGPERGGCKPGGSHVYMALLAGSLPGRAHRKVAPSSLFSWKPLTSALVDCRAQAPLSASRSLCDLNLPTKILR